MTVNEICETIVLLDIDPDLLVEVLQISSEELLDRFDDKVELHLRKLKEVVHNES